MRRPLRIAVLSIGGLLALLLLLVAALIVIGNVGPGRRLLESETARLTAGKVRITGLRGAFPGDIELASLELRDEKGEWLNARQVSLHWSPLALLLWDLHIERLGIQSADVLRRPAGSASTSASNSSSSSSLPAIDVDEMQIGVLVLEPAAAGMRARLHVAGDLHYHSMRNANASLVAKRTNGAGDYEVALRLARSRMSGHLKLEEPAGGPLEHLVNLPDLGALSVIASIEGPRNAEKLALRAHAGELSANADGTVNVFGKAADLTYSVRSPPMSPAPGLAWQRIAVEGRWTGPLAAPQAASAVNLEGLHLPDGTQLGALQAHLAANGQVLTVRAAADGIVLPGSQPQLLQGSPLHVDATLHLAAAGRPLHLTVTNQLLDLDAQAITSGQKSVRFYLRLRDLRPLASAYHENLGGALSVSGQVAEQGQNTTLKLTGTGDVTGAGTAAKLLGTDARLQLSGDMTPATVNVDNLELTGRGLSVKAYGTAERSGPGASTAIVESLRAHWRVSLPHLALIWPSAAGSLETTGTAHGPMQSLAADLQVRSTLALEGAPPGTIEASLQARGLPSTPSATLRASGRLDGAPLRLQASLEQAAANTVHILIPHITWKSVAIHGELTAGRRLAAAGRGNLYLSVASLSDLQPFVGQPLKGGITASLGLMPGAGGTHARFNLIASHVVAAGLSGNARLTAVGPPTALRIALAAQSPNLRGSPADLTAAARLDEVRRVLDLEQFQVRYHGQTAHLIAPARVMYARGLRVRDLRIGAQKAVLALDGELSPVLDFRASVHHLDVGLVDAVEPHRLATGELDAEAQLRGLRTAPVGRASIELTGLKLANAATAGLPAVNLHGSARLRGGSASLFAELDAGRKSKLTLRGRTPLGSKGNVAIRIGGRMDVALVNSLLEARGERATGTLTVDASVTGPAHAPKIGGVVALSHGDLRDYNEGVHLDDVDARLVGGQGVLTIESLTARAGPGRLSAKGTVGVLQPGMPVHVVLSAHRLQPITNDILTANLDANLTVAGTLRQRLNLTGTIHVNHASISVPNGFPPSVATLNVIRPRQKAQPAPTGSPLVIALDLKLDAPAAIFVQGRGLDAQLGGRLKVAGTADDPQVSGGFSMIRGTFSLAGTSLNFTTGKVSFNGEGLKGGIDPTLDFVAQSSVTYNGPTTVTLRITGFADSPKISLSSNPSLPQDDLLGLLLFGEPASKLSAIQLAQTGAALATLSGVAPGGGGGGGSKWNPLTWIKKGLGLNTLSVGSASQPGGTAAGSSAARGGASVTAGKYISNRVYLAAKQTTTGASQVQVDIYLSKYLKLLTRLGNGTATAQGTTPENDPGSSIGIAWQMPY
jgi:translocation and assembly module TamB